MDERFIYETITKNFNYVIFFKILLYQSIFFFKSDISSLTHVSKIRLEKFRLRFHKRNFHLQDIFAVPMYKSKCQLCKKLQLFVACGAQH